MLRRAVGAASVAVALTSADMRIDGPGAGHHVIAATADAASVLRSVGCRVTQPRVAVLRALLVQGGPLDAGQLTELAQRYEPGIHEATVYRTIGVLTDAGLVSHVHAGHGPSLVRLTVNESVVAVCQDCGAIESLPTGPVERLVDAVRAGSGFVLEPGHFALEGVCASCLAGSDDGDRGGEGAAAHQPS